MIKTDIRVNEFWNEEPIYRELARRLRLLPGGNEGDVDLLMSILYSNIAGSLAGRIARILTDGLPKDEMGAIRSHLENQDPAVLLKRLMSQGKIKMRDLR